MRPGVTVRAWGRQPTGPGRMSEAVAVCTPGAQGRLLARCVDAVRPMLRLRAESDIQQGGTLDFGLAAGTKHAIGGLKAAEMYPLASGGQKPETRVFVGCAPWGLQGGPSRLLQIQGRWHPGLWRHLVTPRSPCASLCLMGQQGHWIRVHPTAL